MIRATRRAVVAAALALPVAAHAAGMRLSLTGRAVLVYDPGLESGRRFADAGRARGDAVVPLAGDRIRFAREIFGGLPVSVRGISRQADFVLVGDVAREFGYVRVEHCVAGPVLEWRFVPRSYRD